ncbi:MAG: flagellar motor switch phosphatase FliY [Lachnospiraceae bacterium]|nr:flagellar motor switch phosphatase FliY [Lachnospiraceae bacterium]
MDGMLSQDEINALLNGGGDDASADTASAADASIDEELISEIERDAIGEVANISMGSSATTLFSLVNQKVNITTPVVSLARWGNVLSEYERPCVFIQIKYTVGLDGSNILILKEHDVKVITDLMMGGDGSNTDGELGELHLSAISEAMNQMMGSAATSLSTMLGKMIDISPPEASLVDLTEFKEGGDIAAFLAGTFVKIAFRMQISDLVDSTIMQLYPIEFAKELCSTFLGAQMGGSEPVQEAPAPTPAPAPAQAASQAMPQMDMSQMQAGMPQMDMSQMQMGMPQMMPQMQMGMPQMMPQMQMQPNMSIQPAQFQNFTGDFNPMQPQENIELIKDVPLEVTVELGRTSKSISDILDFAPGTIIELDKIAGEPIDVLVNGKFVAKGEVVVIEESFGVRVTEIIK